MKKIRLTQLRISNNNELYDSKSPKQTKYGNDEICANLSTKNDKRFQNIVSPAKRIIKYINGSSTTTNSISTIFSKKIANLSLVHDLKSNQSNELDEKEKNFNSNNDEKTKIDSSKINLLNFSIAPFIIFNNKM